MDRYHRQTLLPQIGPAGQAKLAAATVAVLGCGALGTVAAELLARAGVGKITLIDRDLVELTNLQRQTLYDEADIDQPKAAAAAGRLGRINSSIKLTPVIADVQASNIHEVLMTAGPPALVVDGSDSAELRYLLNDWCVRESVPWVYGAAVGVTGRSMPIRPGVGPCLQCVFREQPAPGELPTCDTAGVLGPLTAMIGSLQAMTAIALIVGESVPATLTTVDAWPLRVRTIDATEARSTDCRACVLRQFDYLTAAKSGGSASLCGQNATQVTPASRQQLDLASLADRWQPLGGVERSAFFVRLSLPDGKIRLTVFRDARAIVSGTTDPVFARSVYARYVGN